MGFQGFDFSFQKVEVGWRGITGGGKIHQEILEAHGPLEDGLALFVPILGIS